MAENREQFVGDIIEAHDALIDVADELENLLLEVPELGFEPVVIATMNARVSNIVENIDEAHSLLFDLRKYVEGFDTKVPDAGGNTDPAGNVANTIAEPAHVSQPVPAEDNLISKPEKPAQDHVADDATTGVLVDKEDAANSIPGPVSQEGVPVAPVERQEPDTYPSTDQAGDVATTIKPEAEPVRPDADAKDVQGEPKVDGQIDHTAPNDAGVQSPDLDVAIPDEGKVFNEKNPQQQGDAPETDSK